MELKCSSCQAHIGYTNQNPTIKQRFYCKRMMCNPDVRVEEKAKWCTMQGKVPSKSMLEKSKTNYYINCDMCRGRCSIDKQGLIRRHKKGENQKICYFCYTADTPTRPLVQIPLLGETVQAHKSCAEHRGIPGR